MKLVRLGIAAYLAVFALGTHFGETAADISMTAALTVFFIDWALDARTVFRRWRHGRRSA